MVLGEVCAQAVDVVRIPIGHDDTQAPLAANKHDPNNVAISELA